jgi:hypothetical protein
MSDLDDFVERFSLLKQKSIDDDRFFKFYAKCDQLPIAYLEQALDLHKAEARNLEAKVIPDLMFQENRRSIETIDGTTITIRGEVNASLAGSDLRKVLGWLEIHGYGSIVQKKHFLNDEEVTVEQLEKIEKEGITLHADLTCNNNSFKSAVKKIYAETDELPSDDVAKVSIFNRAVIKTEKDEKDE